VFPNKKFWFMMNWKSATSQGSTVRNPFDQYQHHENRLTHALASCLAEDPLFLRDFVLWATGELPPKKASLKVVEQSVPGKAETKEEEPGQRGLPDAWIHDDDGWCLLVESKVAAPIRQDQIRRHLATAERNDFHDRRIVVLSVEPFDDQEKLGIHHRTWRDLYAWIQAGRWTPSPWPGMLAGYMTVAEERMTADKYLKDGTLTAFTGIPFNDDNPYTYGEAKRILGLLLDEMRSRTTLAERLGANLTAAGRKAITGTGANSVWNFLRLGDVDDEAAFTKRPHLTLSIQRDRALAQVTIPNGMAGGLRKALVGQGQDGFTATLEKVLKAGKSVLGKDPGAVPYLMLLQRHYPTQSSEPITDAMLEFDLRTAFPPEGSHVKAQPEWLTMAFHSFANKQSNIQLSVGFSFPYKRSQAIGGGKFADMVERSWLACGPLLEAMGLD